MDSWSKKHKKLVRALTLGVGVALLVVSASGCSTIKVKPKDEHVILIVKKWNDPEVDPMKAPITPEGAVIGIGEELLGRTDEILLINRYGEKVKVRFLPGLVEGEHEFTLSSGEQRPVTLTITDPDMKWLLIDFEDESGDHGGADMGVEPP